MVYTKQYLNSLTLRDRFALFPVGTKISYIHLPEEGGYEGIVTKRTEHVIYVKSGGSELTYSLDSGDVTTISETTVIEDPKTTMTTTIQQLMDKCKVGDSFELVWLNTNYKGVVSKIDSEGLWWNNNTQLIHPNGDIELISVNHSRNLMSNIVSFIKNIGLSPEDKLMLELGLENPTGVPTPAGLEAMNLILYKENRKLLIDTAKAQKAEADAAKK